MRKWIVVVVAVQVAALAWVAAKREWILAFSDTVYLRTAPVDPRDLFRGDYVRLEYDIGSPASELLPALEEYVKKRYQVIYVTLKKDRKGVGEIASISTKKPQSGLFIKGRVGSQVWRRWRQFGVIRFGIEKYFVEQGQGWAIEAKRGRAQQWQTPMELEVALGNDGTAVIKGYRWSALGIRLDAQGDRRVDSTEDRTQDRRRSPTVRISLRNQSTEKVGVLDTAHHCAFLLVQNKIATSRAIAGLESINFANRTCGDDQEWNIHWLTPKQVYQVQFDLADSAWHVVQDDKVIEIADVQNNQAGFRWIYQPPADQLARLESDPRIWNSYLRTARFNARGRVD